MSEITTRERIRQKLSAALTPVYMDISDDSAQHLGHAGSKPEGETHFSLKIVSPLFEGLTSLARHRLIYAILAEEMVNPIHALKLTTITPSEYNRR